MRYKGKNIEDYIKEYAELNKNREWFNSKW